MFSHVTIGTREATGIVAPWRVSVAILLVSLLDCGLAMERAKP